MGTPDIETPTKESCLIWKCRHSRMPDSNHRKPLCLKGLGKAPLIAQWTWSNISSRSQSVYNTEDDFLPDPVSRYRHLLFTSLRFCLAILTSLGSENREAGTQVGLIETQTGMRYKCCPRIICHLAQANQGWHFPLKCNFHLKAIS